MDELVLGRLQHLMTIREGVENLSRPLVWTPAADWIDEGTHLLLLLDVPGVEADSLALSEGLHEVTLSGQRRAPAYSSNHLISAERPQGTFSRTLAFPEEVVPQTGEAQLQHGVLSVRFEKKHPTIDVIGQPQD
ncbi:Hsp20/alpha crystallin family protein [Deinococcus sp.]|uniref:Hsp20/alpha crystallin family protein n=1 Tax=Deinococcus sp. TaxID=47478 RepID=UPI0025BA1592|nr:Hsp20/alpha crystallin family protein [Deinococcus sp.]